MKYDYEPKPLGPAVLCAAFALFFAAAPLRSQPAPSGAGRIEVSFAYTKQAGFGSNQFAVWIEDARGGYVDTLYATNFTASGGWKIRERSLPQWVRQSGLAGMGQTQVDAVSGPTPRAGTLRYVWNGINAAGIAAPPGAYKVYVEATLRGENRVLYTADIRLGENGTVTPPPRYFGDGTAERGMIDAVTVNFWR